MLKYFVIILVLVIAYFLGNINFARVLSKKYRNDDITRHGSGNPGTSNMLRTYGFGLALGTFILDVLKGLLPTLGIYLVCTYGFQIDFLTTEKLMYAAGICAVLGHIYPVIYKFRGGKGVATAVGAFFVINPLIMAIVMVVGFVILMIWDYMSIASLFVVTMFVISHVLYLQSPDMWLMLIAVVTPALIWYAHRGNLKRIVSHSENKANFKRYFKRKKAEESQENIEVNTENLGTLNSEDKENTDNINKK